MKRFFRILAFALAVVPVFASCSGNSLSGKIKFCNLKKSALCKLDEQLGDDSPGLEVNVDVELLEAKDENYENVCKNINRHIISAVVSDDAITDAEDAIDRFVASEVETYKSDYSDVYQEEKRDTGMCEEAMPFAPFRFDHYLHVTGKAEYGFDGIINYTLTEDCYSGGAHPVSYTTKYCFNAGTGSLISLEDVFKEGYEQPLIDLLTDKLMEKQGVKTMDDLQKIGFLVLNDMFVSPEFSLEPNSVTFFYNQYDIAPYSCGTTTISLSYKDLGDLLR